MYKLFQSQITKEVIAILQTNIDGSITSFSLDPANSYYQAFLAWKAEGNEPLPPDEGEQA